MAAKASENAVKFGSIATQKVSELSETVNEKVKEGTIVNDLQSQVSNIGSRVFDVSKKGISDLSNIFTQKNSLYEDLDPNRSTGSFDDDYQTNNYQSYQNSETNDTVSKDLKTSTQKTDSNSMRSSKSTPVNLSTGQSISKEEQVLGAGLNSKSIKKKNEEDDVWSILASDDKPKKTNRRK